MDEAYSFYCARYRDISYEEFLKLPISEFNRKISSVPEGEPLHTIMKSRAINLSKIKDKNERKYWQEMKQLNKIPYAYYYDDNIEIPGGLIWQQT